jgi:hypothetical protein
MQKMHQTKAQYKPEQQIVSLISQERKNGEVSYAYFLRRRRTAATTTNTMTAIALTMMYVVVSEALVGGIAEEGEGDTIDPEGEEEIATCVSAEDPKYELEPPKHAVNVYTPAAEGVQEIA